ncbi:hypothetical protein [Nocardia sp. MW-W600-9]
MPHIFAGAGAALPSGMTKNGTSPMGAANTWTTVPGWTADTTTYPGSVVSGDGLRPQSSHGGAQLSAAVVFAGGTMSGNYQARLLVTGTVVATGAVVTGTSGTMTVTGAASVSTGDTVTLEVFSSVQSTWQATVSGGAGTYVRIT